MSICLFRLRDTRIEEDSENSTFSKDLLVRIVFENSFEKLPSPCHPEPPPVIPSVVEGSLRSLRVGRDDKEWGRDDISTGMSPSRVLTEIQLMKRIVGEIRGNFPQISPNFLYLLFRTSVRSCSKRSDFM